MVFLINIFRERPTYIVTASSAAAANRWHLIIFNGSTSVVRITKIYVYPETTAAITGFPIGFRIFRTSSPGSGGTPLPINKLDTEDPDPPTGIIAMTNPTTAPSTTSLLCYVSTNPEETGGASYPSVLYEWHPERRERAITLRQNQGLGIQQYGTAGAGTFDFVVYFYV